MTQNEKALAEEIVRLAIEKAELTEDLKVSREETRFWMDGYARLGDKLEAQKNAD